MKLNLSVLAIALSGFLMSPWSSAEDQPAALLEEISVSATRDDRPLYNVPAAVGLVDREAIGSGRQMIGLDESLMRIPGLFMQNRYNFAQSLKMSIRGFGARANFGTRGIRFYQDGIPLTTVDGQGGIEDIDLNSIDRIEVIRGPVSSLYGSSSGGVVNFFTGDPPNTRRYIGGHVSLGEYQTRIGNLKAGGAFDKLRYFLNISKFQTEGYRSQSGVRNTRLNSKFVYDIDGRSEASLVFTAYDAPVADDPGSLNRALLQRDRRQAFARNVRFKSSEDIDQQKLGLAYRRDIGASGELILRNYYVRRNFLGLLPIPASGYVEFSRFQFGGGAQYNLQTALFGRPNRATLGFDIDTQQDDRQRFQNVNGQKGRLAVNQLEKGDAIGAYLRNEWALSDRLELTLGLRYDRVVLAVEDRFRADGDQSTRLSFGELSPMGGLLWAVGPGVNLYANISSMFETPTFTELARVSTGGFANVKAQRALNYELGVKGAPNPRFSYELAVFHIAVQDEIINVANRGGRTFFNNADTTRNGLEGSVAFSPANGLGMLLSYTFNDFKFGRFPATQCRGAATCRGNALPGLPRHNFYADLSYTHPSGFFSGIDFQYVGDMFVDNANTERNRAYGVANLRAGYKRTLGGVEIMPYLGINNLFDKEYVGNVRINSRFRRYYEPAPEFNLYAGVNIRYLY